MDEEVVIRVTESEELIASQVISCLQRKNIGLKP